MTEGLVAAALESKFEHMRKLAHMLDTRGYALVVYDRARKQNATNTERIQENFNTVFSSYIRKLGPSNGLIVSVFKRRNYIKEEEKEDYLSYACSMPNRVAYRPIHAVLELNNVGINRRKADRTLYYGSTRSSLELFLSVLDMPHHREILTSPRRNHRS